jgi:hypothetical protein
VTNEKKKKNQKYYDVERYNSWKSEKKKKEKGITTCVKSLEITKSKK